MKKILFLTLMTLFMSCGTKSPDSVKNPNLASDSDTIADDIANNNLSEEEYSETATYYVVVADTGQNYYSLNKQMFEINKKLKIPIDSMGRSYNKSKNLIALPDDSEDEIYAGDYYPRRFPSEHLSLEYLNLYQLNAGEKTIALVSGIYESSKSADSALVILKKTSKKAFKIKSEIFVGCIH